MNEEPTVKNAPLQPHEIVVGRSMSIWEAAFARTTYLYAKAIVWGWVSGTEADTPGSVVQALIPVYGLKEVTGRQVEGGYVYDLNEEAWSTGIGSVHSLADGLVESYDDERHGREGAESVDTWGAVWGIYVEDLLDHTGLTLREFSGTFSALPRPEALQLAARTIVTACDRMEEVLALPHRPKEPTEATEGVRESHNSNDLVYVVITTNERGLVTDAELFDAAPTWDASEIPVGTVQHIRAGYVNGGDTSEERVIVGADAVEGKTHQAATTALRSLLAAHREVVEALEHDPAMTGWINGDLNHLYPYATSFDDLTEEVRAWVEALEAAADGTPVAQINAEHDKGV